MKPLFYSILLIALFPGCKKDHSTKIEIYLLSSFTSAVVQVGGVPALSISNAVLAGQPLVADKDISFYTASTSSFKLNKDIKGAIQSLSTSAGFAVTVNKEPVYYGVFHPGFLSSMTIGVATIDPILFYNRELFMHFIRIDGNTELTLLDRRNDTRLLNALRASGRLR
ncbi:MAG: hypothetical protein J0M10_17515 [Chitinophagales bacterium]|nr:hypothetical protein [Chitinophagales bacterium]